MVQIPVAVIDTDVLASEIAKQLKGIPAGPTTMGVNDFAKQEKLSRNYILEHRDEIPQIKIGGKWLVNMIAWREKLTSAK